MPTKQQTPRPRSGKPCPLTPKQERFVREYLIDLNATQAAIRAGYAHKTAYSIGHENLKKPEIQAAIEAGMQERAGRTQITADNVLRELAYLAFSDMGQVLDFTGDTVRLRAPQDIPEAARRALSTFKVKRTEEGRGDDAVPVEVLEFKLWSKEAALEKLGKHLKLFTEKHEHSGTMNVNHGIDLTKLSDEELVTLERILAAAEARADPGGAGQASGPEAPAEAPRPGA